jgi:sugar phosphate isomerase/epimerase
LPVPVRPPVIAVSSWSLHRTIGKAWWDAPGGTDPGKPAWGPGTLSVLDLPAAVARHGIHRLQLCHFHVTRRDKAWFGEFRAALADAGVTLQTLLIDEGDISHPVDHREHVAWTAEWIERAAMLGAKAARVVAGKQAPTAETIARAAAGLSELAALGKSLGVRIVTENWHALLSTPAAVHAVMDRVGNDLGLLADFGNWSGPQKYADLAAILPRAEDTHAKAAFSAPGIMDTEDYGRCVDLAAAAGYAGPYTLIYDGPGEDEWAGIAAEEAFIRHRLTAMAAV